MCFCAPANLLTSLSCVCFVALLPSFILQLLCESLHLKFISSSEAGISSLNVTAMREEYSFADASQCKLVSYDSRTMNDSTPSESSRGASPFSARDLKERPLPTTCSISELSERFRPHSLQPQPPAPIPPGPFLTERRIATHARRKRCASPNNSNRKGQHRQALVRRQCSSANLSRLMALARVLETPSYDASEDALLQDRESFPQHQIHSTSCFAQPTLNSPPESNECKPQILGITAGPHQHTAGKGPRHYNSRDALASPKLVHKDIRLRTKWRSSTSCR